MSKSVTNDSNQSAFALADYNVIKATCIGNENVPKVIINNTIN